MNTKELAKVLQGIIEGKFEIKTNYDTAREVLDEFFEAIGDNMKEHGKVKVEKFGTFEVRERAGRNGRNPSTQEPMWIEPTVAPAFKPLGALKDKVKG